MISILFPVYNEEEIIESSIMKVHSYLSDRNIEHEIIATSNGSTDNTDSIGSSLESKYDWFRFFSIPKRGVGAAFVNNVKEAQGETLVCLDIDLPSELCFIEYSTNLLDYADMVIGSKFMGTQYRPAVRILGSQVYIILSQWLFGTSFSDFSLDCKAYKRKAILPAIDHLDKWTGYVFELCLYFLAKEARIIQVAVNCEDRRKSKFNIIHEGLYRYGHLYRSWRMFLNKKSWFHSG